jgi:hypothetical protein
MKLCSIISAWADTICILPYAIQNHLKFCDGVIVVWSMTSNHGAVDKRMLEFVATHNYQNVLFHQVEPIKKLKPLINETRKRNIGLDVAKREGYTHFFLADADELYIPEQVSKDKALFFDPQINGLVCRLMVYVGKPTLTCHDTTLVPFIHKLRKDTIAGRFQHYPFAYDKKRTSHIDPSRRLNERAGIIMSNTVMHHFSYLRADINLKIQNSTAKLKNREALIKRDIVNAAPGYVSELYHRPLQEVENYFEIAI